MKKVYYDGDEKRVYDTDDLKEWIEPKNKGEKEIPKSKGYYNRKELLSIPLHEVVERYGGELIPTGSNYKLSCILPTHGSKDGDGLIDKHPSAFVYTDSNKYYCHAEGVLLSVTDFVGVMEGLLLSEAKSKEYFKFECQKLIEKMGQKESDYYGDSSKPFTTAELELIGIVGRKNIEIPEMGKKLTIDIFDETYFEKPEVYYIIASKAIDKREEISERKERFEVFCQNNNNISIEEITDVLTCLDRDYQKCENILSRAEKLLAECEKPQYETLRLPKEGVSYEESEEEEEIAL